MNIEEFTEWVGVIDDDKLKLISDIVLTERKARHERKLAMAGLRWKKGDIGYFVHRGELIRVTVNRVNRKTLSATATSGGRWRVAPTLLYRTKQEAWEKA